MLKWFQKFVGENTSTPNNLVARLAALEDDEELEEIWDGMDANPEAVAQGVRALFDAPDVPDHVRYSAAIWLGYTRANRGEPLPEGVGDVLEDASVWALTCEANNVLIGGALGCFDALTPADREALALRVFERLGDGSARKYWLLLKVRTDAMMEAVVASFREFSADERAKLAGAFRQFHADDLPLIERHYRPGSLGSEFLEMARAAARSNHNAT